ncbi:MAG: phosphoenolpyruvate--protein phosphotransferase [Phycisphaerales bacterium]|nr:phosphoenolpyruvate--protein phosphotransferase [Phycisphaerales bacterium]
MQTFRGIPVSPGVAIGRVVLVRDDRHAVSRRAVAAASIADECARLDRAIEASLDELADLRTRAEQELGKEAAAIFAFHQGMLRDPSLINPMREQIEQEKINAEYAVQEQFRVVAGRFAGMGDTAFSTKVDDVWDLDDRVLKHLTGSAPQQQTTVGPNSIIVANDLTPSQAAAFPRGKVLGFVTGRGGATSHTAILARALGIPAAVGAAALTEAAMGGEEVIVDGDLGIIVLRPDADTKAKYARIIERVAALRATVAQSRTLPAQTKDGTSVSLQGNIEFGKEAGAVIDQGGAGVGLFRTEFLWLTSDHDPTEDEQFAEYKSAVEKSKGDPVTIRTFDLGADKLTQAQAMAPERNPVLGCRSIRYSLQNIPMFRSQLRAIMRASVLGPVRIMFPLVTNVSELRQARMILSDVTEELVEEGVPIDRRVKVGIMVEAPSVAVMASSFAREVDFFSIGTNDLIQYTLAVDRTNEKVANLYAGTHPAVIKLIKEVARAARRRGVETSVCGEMAGDATYTMLLLGLGLRTLSVTPNRIPHLKAVVRAVDIGQCELLARRVGSLDSERQVAAFLRSEARKRFPELVDGRTGDEEPD